MRAVNLIPEEQRGGAAIGTRSGGAAFIVLGLLAGIVVLAVLYGLAHHRLESRRAEAEHLSAQAQQVQTQATRLAPYTSFMALREQRMQAVAQLIAARFDWSNVMGELSSVLPNDVALTTVQGAIGSASGTAAAPASPAAGASGAVASATPPGTNPTITLGGCASSQSVVAQMLVRLRLIDGVSAVSLQSSTKSSGSGSCANNDPVFSVELTFNPLPAPSAAAGGQTP